MLLKAFSERSLAHAADDPVQRWLVLDQLAVIIDELCKLLDCVFRRRAIVLLARILHCPSPIRPDLIQLSVISLIFLLLPMRRLRIEFELLVPIRLLPEPSDSCHGQAPSAR